MVKILGWNIGRDEPINQYSSFVPPKSEGAVPFDVPALGGTMNFTMDLGGTVRTESELIARYREMAMHAEVDTAIDDIVNESIITDDIANDPVKIDLSKLELPDNIKQYIEYEFQSILRLLDFNRQGYEIYRGWYIDGRKYYYLILDEENPNNGIQEIREVDALKLRKVREISQVPDQEGLAIMQNVVNEYYVYSDNGFQNMPQVPVHSPSAGLNSIRISTDSIVAVTSGLQNQNGTMVLSYMHPAIKPLNQLRMLEDAVIIYRLVRAPARRVFYLDVGGLPKHKADQYVRDTMNSHKNKLEYDQSNGTIADARKFVTMTEDYWLPRREGSGTQIQTLDEGQNLGEMEDVNYFQQQLYKALRIPITRLDTNNPFSLGRPTEITRDELKFMKFISRLRMQFSQVFLKLLEKQLILKQIIAPEEWELIEQNIQLIYTEDSYFEELKNSEILRDRAQTTNALMPLADIFVTRKDIFMQVWRLTEEQYEEKMAEIQQELKMYGPTNPELQEESFTHSLKHLNNDKGE